MVIKDLTDRIGEVFGKNLNRNLTDFMERNNISLTVLHRNTGVAIPTIKRLQEDPTTNPTLSTLIPIANFFNISVNQLIGNDTEIFFETNAHYLKVPYIGWIETRAWPNLLDKSQKKYTYIDIEAGNTPYALIVEEHDWLNMPKGTILIINADTKTPRHNDYLITCKKNHYPTLYQIVESSGSLYLKSPNPQLPLILYDESYQFLGKLIQIRQNIRI